MHTMQRLEMCYLLPVPRGIYNCTHRTVKYVLLIAFGTTILFIYFIGRANFVCCYFFLQKEEMLQAEESLEETQLPPSMKLLGTSCQCKTTATQTAPASDEEDKEVDCGKMRTAEVAEATEAPVNSNPDRSGRKKLRQHSNQSSSGRIDSIFDGGTDSSATAAQIVGIDQWSSSGTESTTGVIIRSGVTAEWTNEQEAKPSPEPPIAQPQQEHVASYPRRTEKSENVIFFINHV